MNNLRRNLPVLISIFVGVALTVYGVIVDVHTFTLVGALTVGYNFYKFSLGIKRDDDA